MRTYAVAYPATLTYSAAKSAADAAAAAAGSAASNSTNFVYIIDSAIRAVEELSVAALAMVSPGGATEIFSDIWNAVNFDISILMENPISGASLLTDLPLWLSADGRSHPPSWCSQSIIDLQNKLPEIFPNGRIWIEWYQSRLDGGQSWGLNSDNAETLMLHIVKQSHEWWKQGPVIVNAEIAKWLADFRAKEAREKQPDFNFSEELVVPIEPEQSAGLSYGFSGGKLSASGSHPMSDEAVGQENLFQRVKSKAEKLNGLLLTTANQYPELAEAAAEYLELIGQPIEQFDIDSLWSVGGALFELKTAYSHQNHSKTMSSELEPPQTAALSGLCRDHGAFILGFERGEELVERADRFAQNIRRAEEIIEPSKPVLAHLTNDRELVEDETRKLHKVILDALNETDWVVSRTSYSAYITIRNGTLSIAKLLFGSMGQGLIPIALQFAGAAAIAGYNVDQTAVINAVQFLQLHGAQLLTIFKHSPEMHAYVQAAIDLIKREKKLLEND